MKKAGILLLIVTAVVGGSIAKMSSRSPDDVVEAETPGASAVDGAIETVAVEGTLVSVDGSLPKPKQYEIYIDQKNGESVSLTFDPDKTVVLIGGQAAPAGELVEGQRIKAHVTTKKNGEQIVTSIVVNTPVLTLPPKLPPIQGNPIQEPNPSS
ncbi:MAG: hypothetical protein HY594_05190 [Candidatus Omnitrophica bacterium]|nr:hypothetical protein [Candidatus Omnitrophota bacterium]